ncbi:MAG TPA: thioredoxin domain-containing protein [Cryobacterium sp.]|nr:thioredoxin domain-containing protein [Cryobacterium sp.]
MSNVYGKPVPPKKDRREMARESARQLREEQQKKDKRNRWLLRGGIGAGLIAAAVVVALVVVGNQGPAAPGPLNMASDGVLLTGDGTNIVPVETVALAADEDPIATDPSTLGDTANIVVYADYLCPFCGQFEITNGEQIAGWVAAGTATLQLHPISILDQASAGSKYPTRAAAALACVANYEPENVLAMNATLFANQPTENTEGLTDDDLVSLATSAGVTDEKVATCITENTFASWVGDATKRALDGPIPNADIEQIKGTPTVLVNGVSYPGALDDPAAFEAFVTAQVTAAGE